MSKKPDEIATWLKTEWECRGSTDEQNRAGSLIDEIVREWLARLLKHARDDCAWEILGNGFCYQEKADGKIKQPFEGSHKIFAVSMTPTDLIMACRAMLAEEDWESQTIGKAARMLENFAALANTYAVRFRAEEAKRAKAEGG